jgi:hypothetical protein
MDMDAAAADGILLWGSILALAGGAYALAGGAGVSIAIGFVVFVNFQREKLTRDIRAARS